MGKPRDIDHSQWNRADPQEWAQDFMAHVAGQDISTELMTEWFRDAMRAAVTYRLVNPQQKEG